MESTSLLATCSVAFISVFFLLSILALSMWAITKVFPEREPASDPALVAVISGTVATLIPGARVTKIEEVK